MIFRIPSNRQARFRLRIGGGDATEAAQDDGIGADLFRDRLDQIINMKHELVQLAGKVDWDWIDGESAPLIARTAGQASQPTS